MRNDPASAAIIIVLCSLKMYDMPQAVNDLKEQGGPAFNAAVPMRAQLLKAVVAVREVRLFANHMKAVRFPAYKDLSGFDLQPVRSTRPRCANLIGARSWTAHKTSC